jgi:hypothetical protein
MADQPQQPNSEPRGLPTREALAALARNRGLEDGLGANQASIAEKLRPFAQEAERLKGLFARSSFLADVEPAPTYRPPTQEEANSFQSAAVLLRRLAAAIAAWRATLPTGVEPGVVAVLQGGSQVEVTRLAQESFHGIRIDGEIDGLPVMLLAHQATVQILCHPRASEPERRSRPIGFVIEGRQSEA